MKETDFPDKRAWRFGFYSYICGVGDDLTMTLLKKRDVMLIVQ